MNNPFDLFEDGIVSGYIKVSLSFKIISVGASLATMFRYEKAEMKRLDCANLFANPFMLTHLKLKFKQEGELINERVLLKKSDHSNFWARLSLRLDTREKKPVLTGIVEDISDLITVENHMKNLENNYSKVKYELDRFIYSASHDIRSPVSSILGLLNIMKMEFTDEKSKNFVDLMDVSVKRLDRFILDLSSYAQSSQKQVKTMPIDFESNLSEVLEQFENHHNRKRVVVKSELFNEAVFSSDSFKIQTLLGHLIKNTFDFCDLGKTLSTVSVSIKTSKEKAQIEIFDNGIGIARTHLNQVFDMFYKGSSQSKGSGLGLYVAREIVYTLGGKIEIYSELGVGTTVKVEIPNSYKGVLATKKMRLKHSSQMI